MKTYESGDDGEGWSSNILFVCLFVCRECQAKLKAEFCGRENGPSQCLKDQAQGKYSLMVVTGEECMCFVFLSYFLQRCLFLIDITSLLLILSEGDTANPNQISSQQKNRIYFSTSQNVFRLHRHFMRLSRLSIRRWKIQVI